jgi:hypothetical protein
VLECDESRFQAVIAELANSVLPLEVREVRINPPTDNASQGGRVGRDRNRQAAPMGGVSSVMHNATVEIFGLAYLVNPPDPVKLKLETAAGDTAAAGATANEAATGTAKAGATTGTAATDATPTNAASATTPASGTSTTTTAGDAAKSGASPAKGPDATTPAPPATGGNATGNGAAGTSTTTTTAPPSDAPAK